MHLNEFLRRDSRGIHIHDTHLDGGIMVTGDEQVPERRRVGSPGSAENSFVIAIEKGLVGG